ncbi:MAG: hypothetical protein IT488_06225 [Gammaproteobacteria bacterium]|nr:hypothetical protein [Gammaproteobacteria bacterium]
MGRQIEVSGEWSAFLMYLCVNADKAWEKGLAGADVAEQMCVRLGVSYERTAIVHALSRIKFEPMTLAINYRELNELTKFSMWCREDVGQELFQFITQDQSVNCLSKNRVQKLTEYLWSWREQFQSNVHYIPDGVSLKQA